MRVLVCSFSDSITYLRNHFIDLMGKPQAGDHWLNGSHRLCPGTISNLPVWPGVLTPFEKQKNLGKQDPHFHRTVGNWAGRVASLGLGHVLSSSSQSPPPLIVFLHLPSLSCLLGSSRCLSHLSYFAHA